MNLEIITFKDHFHENDEWIDPQKYTPKDLLLEYVGWVTAETPETIVLSQGRTIDDDSVEYDSHMHIIKSTVITRNNLNIP